MGGDAVVYNRPYDFDLGAVNPIGFAPSGSDVSARLVPAGRTWNVEDGDTLICEIDALDGISADQLAVLRRYQSLQIEWVVDPGEPASLRTIAELAVAGVPLEPIGPVPVWAEPLGTELCDLIGSMNADSCSDPLLRELFSVRLRRTALESHADDNGWNAPAMSAILCTCRPEFVSRSIEAVNRQTYTNLEIVLVLHGVSATEKGIAEAISRSQVPVETIEVDSSTVFGDALNLGIKTASGNYVTKMDDDDWYGRHHVSDLVHAKRYADAVIVGSFTEFVHLDQLNTTIYRPAGHGEKYTRFVAGGTVTAEKSEILELGGFPSVPSAVDVGLFDRARETDARIYRIHGTEYVLSRRQDGHTWDVEVGYFLSSSERQFYKKRVGEHVVADSLEQCLNEWKSR